MNDRGSTFKQGKIRRTFPSFQWGRPYGLQVHMTISYVLVTVAAVLVLEILGLTLNGLSALHEGGGPLIKFVLASLAIAAPVGGLFGLITTHSLVHRLHHLLEASTHFTDGNYTQRLQVRRPDEVGQLEYQFNRMAEQLVTSIAQQQALAEQNARMQERARISRDLHDAVSQNLFSLRAFIDGLQAEIMAGAAAPALLPHITLLEQTTSTMTREMRALLLEMRPPQLECLGLAEALQMLAEAYTSRLGLVVTTSISSVLRLHASVEQTLLRITQEALSNAARHANASLISLSLTPQDQSVCLSIVDNGRGMNLEERRNTYGLGLRLIQERVQELRGSFLLDTTPGQGTCLEICVPQEAEYDSCADC